MMDFLNYEKKKSMMKYLGSTLVKTAPLVMCSLAILFAYKVGFFNIGAAGQYVAGAAVSLFCALKFNNPGRAPHIAPASIATIKQSTQFILNLSAQKRDTAAPATY